MIYLSFCREKKETLRFGEAEGQDNFQVSAQLTNPKTLFLRERTIIERPRLLPDPPIRTYKGISVISHD